MKTANWTNRKRFLNKAELNHLKEDAACFTKAQFQNNINEHAKMRIKFPEIEPCFECKFIAKRLNMKAGD